MSTPSTSLTSAQDQMKGVKAAVGQRPRRGPEKDAAHKHYAAAEEAMAAKNEAERCVPSMACRADSALWTHVV